MNHHYNQFNIFRYLAYTSSVRPSSSACACWQLLPGMPSAVPVPLHSIREKTQQPQELSLAEKVMAENFTNGMANARQSCKASKDSRAGGWRHCPPTL